MQWALTTQKVCGTVLGGGGESPGVTRRCLAKVEPIGPYVFLLYGQVARSVQGCLRNHSGAIRPPKY
jgi:hypothetical protein